MSSGITDLLLSCKRVSFQEWDFPVFGTKPYQMCLYITQKMESMKKHVTNTA